MSGRTQLAVIGAGPGGYAAAFRAADLGLNVTLIDPRPAPGGVCLWEGCIPSKALLHAVATIDHAHEAAAFGIAFGAPAIDAKRLAAWKQHDVVERLTGGLKQLADRRGVTYVQGRAAFAADGGLAITHAEETQLLSFDQALIATGSHAFIPPLLNIASPRLWTAREALQLDTVPERLLVVGGGYIGLEMATVYAALGTQVTVVEMTGGLLPGADRDLVRVVAKGITSRVHAVHLNTRVDEVADTGAAITATLANGGKVWKESFDAALIATGRSPLSTDLGLEHTRVQTDPRGFIRVGKDMRTHDPRILAIGDVVGQPMLAHKATHEGLTAAAVAAGRPDAFDPAAIPAVVFTRPELAWVGLTETQATAQNIPVVVGRFPWAASGRAIAVGATDGVTKILLDPESERVLGVGIVGEGAGELIAAAALALEMGATAEDIARTIHPHPSLSETVMEGAEAALGASIHLFQLKRARAGDAT